MAKKRTRASNGMGSIRQRSDGLWEARYSAPDDKQHSVYAKTEKAVTAKLRAALHDLDAGAWREPSKMTVGEWLEIWLTDYQGHISERTLHKYRCIVNKHFKPLLGDVRMTKLLPMHIRRLVSQLQAQGRAASTIHLYIGILSTALQNAVETGIITDNPAAKVKLQRVPPKTFHVIDRGDIPAFVDAARKTAFDNELLLMLYTGMRVGEIRGLKWSDVDLDAGTIHVSRQLQQKSGTMQQLTPPKYGEDRVLHLPGEAVEVLRAQKRKQAQQRLAAGADWHEDDLSRDLVFRQRSGKPHSDKSIFRAVRAAGSMIGIPELHPHDLRHSYAVAALRSGADVKTVQHNLGHKTASMTLDVYAAYTDDAGQRSAEMLSEYLKNAGK